jgi:nitrite reductase (NO-forming)
MTRILRTPLAALGLALLLGGLTFAGCRYAESLDYPAAPVVTASASNPGNANHAVPVLPPLRGVEQAVITYAPTVPPPITRNHATRVVVRMETSEIEKELADGVTYTMWTFNGEVPGPFVRVREGDLVEFHLGNHPSSKVPHNIDLHAVTGPGGGAEATFVLPGKEATFEFRALNPGLYVYHCATGPVGLHVANGMYGLILVEPAEGLPQVDREYYVMQSEFYTAGAHGEQGFQPFDLDKALSETPDYVVFNGRVGSMMNENALSATVGERVRLFLGNGGPNLSSSFHVIGEVFDNVYGEGGTMVNQRNVQTTMIPAGGSSIVDFRVEVPGNLTLVDHAIFRAFNKGAVGILRVDGPENHEIFSEQIELRDYNPSMITSRTSQTVASR